METEKETIALKDAAILKAYFELQQEKHKKQRTENKARYLKERKRKMRTHRLITVGASFEHFFPKISEMTEQECYSFAQELSDLYDSKKSKEGDDSNGDLSF